MIAPFECPAAPISLRVDEAGEGARRLSVERQHWSRSRSSCRPVGSRCRRRRDLPAVALLESGKRGAATTYPADAQLGEERGVVLRCSAEAVREDDEADTARRHEPGEPPARASFDRGTRRGVVDGGHEGTGGTVAGSEPQAGVTRCGSTKVSLSMPTPYAFDGTVLGSLGSTAPRRRRGARRAGCRARECPPTIAAARACPSDRAPRSSACVHPVVSPEHERRPGLREAGWPTDCVERIRSRR